MSRKTSKRINYDDILTQEQLAELSVSVARKYARHHNLPKGYTTPQREDNPPICKNDGCINPKAAMEHQWFTGAPIYRPICEPCHQQRTAGKHGLKTIAQVVAKNAGYSSVSEYLDAMAVKEGYKSNYDKLNKMAIAEGYKDLMDKKNQEAIAEGYKNLTEKMNAKHPYRKHRKDYCENIDGRLGYTCTANIVWEGQLDVDHIDGHYKNNDPANLQTLCKCCHAYKTNVYKDYATPGRTSIKEQDKNTLDIMTEPVYNEHIHTDWNQDDNRLGLFSSLQGL